MEDKQELRDAKMKHAPETLLRTVLGIRAVVAGTRAALALAPARGACNQS